jgi:hypothetical protein
VVGALTDTGTEDVEDHLTNDEEKYSKRNVPQRPAIMQSVDDQNNLHGQIDHQAEGIDDVDHDEQAGGAIWREASPTLERQQRDGSGKDEHAERRKSEKPDRESGAIFI